MGKWHAQNKLWKIDIGVNVFGSGFFTCLNSSVPIQDCSVHLSLLKGAKQTSLNQNISPKHG